MGKLIIIGIDGLDSNIISKFGEDLPNFKKLKATGLNINLTSVYPHDSETAWSTVYTGLNPAKHGVVDFKNPFDKLSGSSALADAESDIRKSLCGNTFWDYASEAGKKVCILFPHAVYPPWKINGTMVCRSIMRSNNKNPIQSIPSSISREHILSDMNTVRSLPTKKTMRKYIESCANLLQNETEFGLKMLNMDNWDLFFMYSSSVDAIQHVFWNYCDENDPTYPGNNDHKNIIKTFYKYYDEMIGLFMSKTGIDDTIIVLSDHGHGMRPIKLINFNERLRKLGYLQSKIKNDNGKNIYHIIEKLKDNLSNFLTKFGLLDITAKFVRAAPITKKIFIEPLSIDWEKSIACVSDPNGIKAYSYGGIAINRENLLMDYEEFRDLLINEFSVINDPLSGQNLIKWICKREELYEGKYVAKYPDIVFELVGDYGVGWKVHSDLITKSHTHGIQPGGHKADSAVFFISSRHDNIKKNIKLEDIAPSVLQLLNVQHDYRFDGKSILLNEI